MHRRDFFWTFSFPQSRNILTKISNLSAILKHRGKNFAMMTSIGENQSKLKSNLGYYINPNSTQPVYSPDILQYQVTYPIGLRYYGQLAEFGHDWYVPVVSISISFDPAIGSLAHILLINLLFYLFDYLSI